MMKGSVGFTVTDLIASASQVLLANGYQQIIGRFSEWETSTLRLFEDEYGIVGLAVFETCADLLRSWSEIQDKLVDVISRNVGKQEFKAWDGYLVLLTPSLAPSETDAIELIRYDIRRVRKLVATGDDLVLATDVRRVLRPLLPLRLSLSNPEQISALDLLPKLLKKDSIAEAVTRRLIEAHKRQEPLLERLHDQLGEQ
jgi:hypothetical protein